METQREVKVIMVDLPCPTCKKGLMRPNGNALLSNPAKYEHTCTECGHTVMSEKKYPYINYQ